jgi:hypothetical protein
MAMEFYRIPIWLKLDILAYCRLNGFLPFQSLFFILTEEESFSWAPPDPQSMSGFTVKLIHSFKKNSI